MCVVGLLFVKAGGANSCRWDLKDYMGFDEP
jgi:hypothetical protein